MDVAATIILVIMLFSIIITLLMPSFEKGTKIKFVTGAIVLGLLIIIIGHSTWNREFQIRNEVGNFAKSGDTRWQLPKSSTTTAALSISLLSSEMIETPAGSGIIENAKINDADYKITAISYEEPFGWTPYQVWKVTDIKKSK